MAVGRKKKPTHLKVVSGTLQKCRENPNEPKPSTAGIKMPLGLTPRAKTHWANIVKRLKTAGVMTVMDVDALAMYCEQYATWRKANEELKNKGEVILTTRGDPILSPWFKVSQTAFEGMKKLLTEFGMTPASRPKVSSTGQKKKKSDWDQI